MEFDNTKAKQRQQQREKQHIYSVDESSKKPKFYVLDMFPYPSGAGLHVGHPKGYVATDVLARLKMLQGYNVLHPMGWDAFGLPAEQYAIKNKVNPTVSTAENVARYKQQLTDIGFTYDRGREVNTTDPNFYKRTQRTFIKLYEHYYDHTAKKAKPINELPIPKGLSKQEIERYKDDHRLAYVDYKPILRSVNLQTAISQEDLDENGNDERTGGPVERRPMRQRVIRITDYADRLLEGLDELTERPDNVKQMQRHWIGKAEGTEFTMKIANHDANIGIYTTRIDTVYGMSYVALAPEHELIEQITTPEHKKEVEKYIKAAKLKGELQRTDLNKDKTGVFTGAYAINPFNNQQVPIRVADYVLGGYGTGAVMAVPAHDERDFAFAKKYDLPITTSIIGNNVKIPEIISYPCLYTNNQKVVDKAKNDDIKENSESKTTDKTYTLTSKNGLIEDLLRLDPKGNIAIMAEKGILVNAGSKEGKKTIIILHGTEGNSKKNRYDRLKNELIKEGHNVLVPDMPDSDYPVLEKRLSCLEQYKDQIDENSVIIGHSLGAPTAIQFIQKHNKKVGQLILIAPTHRDMNREEYNQKNPSYNNENIQTVSQTPTDRKKMQSLVQSTHIFFSKDDPYIPLQTAELYKRDMNAIITIFEDKGHFNQTGLGQKELPELLTYCKEHIFLPGYTGMSSDDAITAMQSRLKTQGIGGKKTQYKLQDRVFSRQRYRGEPIPMIHTADGMKPIKESELPLKLPEVEHYEPTGTEEGPLANITDWVNTPEGKRETNTMPQRAGSSRYRLRYMDPKNPKNLVDPAKEKYRGQVDVYVGGMEHATRHLIYARFWHKFLYDIGVVSTSEPFRRLYGVGLVLAEDGRKMSKRRGNVVNPDDVIEEYGADAFRTYEMFMGPFENEVARSTAGVKGVKKFLDKITKLTNKIDKDYTDSKDVLSVLHKTIKKVSEDIENFRFNTAISQLMICVNTLTDQTKISSKTLEILTILISPFAPHLAEEIRCEVLGNDFSIFTKAKRPVYDEKLLIDETIKIAVQFNGKVRGTIQIAPDATQDDVMAIIQNDPSLASRIESEPKKIIYIAGKIINIIV